VRRCPRAIQRVDSSHSSWSPLFSCPAPSARASTASLQTPAECTPRSVRQETSRHTRPMGGLHPPLSVSGSAGPNGPPREHPEQSCQTTRPGPVAPTRRTLPAPLRRGPPRPAQRERVPVSSPPQPRQTSRRL